MEANKIDRLRHIIDNIRQLNDEWFDTFPTDDGQTSIHDTLECEVIDANKILDLPLRNCDRFGDEVDAQATFLNEVWLISVTNLKDDPFDEWTPEMKARYAKWLLEMKDAKDGGDAEA